ncbi:MAG TPA: tetratricopeptide repeat protein, partial [Blastocatellia bacterium]|nr:tetratricopeptide repeat protein [Blastocatellia bacterium]
YARQQGIATLIVSQGWTLDEVEKQWCPRWIRDAHCYELNRDWEALIRLLQSPPPTARVPFMAPDLPSNYVDRPEEINRLKDAFLLVDAPEALRNVGLWGPAGCGKKVLAQAFCHNEDVMAHFCDGILWAVLGTEPDVLGEITKLYVALTGERPGFIDEREAAQRLSERLSGKNCLLVVEDSWDLKTLKPLLDAAPRCHKLILTRDLNILTSINATAITPGDFRTDEAVALLTSQLHLTPDEAAMFAPFTERLGQWPLALRLANAQLRKLMSQGISAREALEYMNQALNKLGVLAFDQPNVPDGDESVARSMALTMNHLSEEERERYAQIAFFPPEETITAAKLAARWRLDEFEAEKLLQRFAELALIRYDLSTKVVKLGSKLRDYILSPASGYNINSRYDAAFDHMSSEEQAVARRVLARLVRLALPNERAGDTRLTAELDEFDADENRVIPSLANARLVEIDSNASGARTVQLAGEEVLRNWRRLQQWLQEDREFLLWRQSLRRQIGEWQEHRDRGALLSGVPLQIAATYLKLRTVDLNQAERNYIAESQTAELEVQTKLQTAEESKQIAAQSVQQLQRTRVLGAFIVAGLVLIGLVVGSFLLYRAIQGPRLLTQAINANTRGLTQAEQGNLDTAIASYQEAIRLKSDYTEAYINLAKAWQVKGNTDEAINAYSRAIELGLSDAAVFAARGDMYVAKNDFNRAIEDYSKAIAGSPDNASYYTARSNAYQALNRTDEARSDFEKARELTARPSPQSTSTQTEAKLRVYLHYNDFEDGDIVRRLAKDLRGKGYEVVREELRPESTKGDIRYFSDRDSDAAAELRDLVKTLLGEKSPSDIQVIPWRTQKYVVPYGQLEIWLPSLSHRATSNYEQKTEAPQQKMKATPTPARQEVQKKMPQKY